MKMTNKAHSQKNSYGNLIEIKFCIKCWNVKYLIYKLDLSMKDGQKIFKLGGKPGKVSASFKKKITVTVCSCHVTYVFQIESTLYSCLNIKELLARNPKVKWLQLDSNPGPVSS